MANARIKRISARSRKDPLTDLKTLGSIGRLASKKARENAFAHGATITIAKKGIVYQIHPDGTQEQIKKLDNIENFPTLEEDLCQG